MLAVPAYVEWGESLASLPVGWMPHVVAMGAAYLALATVVVLIRPGPTLRGVLDVVAATVGVYGAALVLLSARPDIPVSRQVVAFSISLALFFALLPIVLQRRRAYGFVIQAVLLLAVSGLWNQKSGGIPLSVAFGDSRSLSKVPFIIASEQGLFEKYGLDVELWLPPEEGESEIAASQGGRPAHPDILVDGHSPLIYRMVTEANFPAMVALAGGDCLARTHIIGRRDLDRLEDLKGKRLGVNRQRATTGFVARLLARRMGWDPTLDISIWNSVVMRSRWRADWSMPSSPTSARSRSFRRKAIRSWRTPAIGTSPWQATASWSSEPG